MKKKRLSRYDSLFVLALIVGLLLVFLRFQLLDSSPLTDGGATAEIAYTLRADSASRLETLSQAESIFFADTHALLGRQKSEPKITPARIEALRSDGTLSYPESPASFELRGTILANGTVTENGFFLSGGRHITANQTIPVEINGLNVTILVLNINYFSSN